MEDSGDQGVVAVSVSQLGRERGLSGSGAWAGAKIQRSENETHEGLRSEEEEEDEGLLSVNAEVTGSLIKNHDGRKAKCGHLCSRRH